MDNLRKENQKFARLEVPGDASFLVGDGEREAG